MAKQLVGIGSSANDGTGDTLRDGAIKYNSNFDEIYERLGNNSDILFDVGPGIVDGQVLKWSSSPTPAFRGGDFDTLTGNLDTNGNQIVSDGTDDVILHQTGTGDIKLWAGGTGSAYTYIDGDDGYLKWYAPYDTMGDLPTASTHHGMFAHVHETGKGYFAHNATWVKLLDENDGIGSLSDVDMTVGGGPADGQVLKWNATNSAWEPANDLTTTNGGTAPTPNLFETVTADTGSTTASAPNDTLNIVGGTNISTSLSGDTLTITMTGDLGDPDQNVFTTFGADNGQTTATITTDTLNFFGGAGISTNLNAGAITITNTAPNVVQDVLKTIAGDTGSYTATTSTDTVTIAGGAGITTSVSGSILTVSADASVTLPEGFEGASLVHDGTQYVTAASPTLYYSVTSNGTSAYRFTGPGIDSATDDPTFYVYRGFTYKFDNTTGGSHPFEIRFSDGGAAVTAGVSGSSTGTTTYTIPMTLTPGTTYVYQCTIHSGMIGNIVVV
ncbi:baseplate wedge protein [Synechococcus phage S-SZBM1]|uniref:Baseplate wedge protein n=1 Tax=Synechococcus phage S-SZBM1 TaxID=2926475 RepID=A0AC61TSV8_9CAUD|nr:baseplate wedge protein [Synechococcus phage S-SZBM1]UNH61323.1 baseplate wedge protein [Synechococcus phage S-SZBM1]